MHNMRCRAWEEQIIAAVDGKLGAEEFFRLQQHMYVCAECAAKYAWQKGVHAALQKSTPVKAPEKFNEAVWERLTQVPQPGRGIRRWAPSTLGMLGLAATAAAALIVVTYQALQEQPKTPVEQKTMVEKKIETPQTSEAVNITVPAVATPVESMRAQTGGEKENIKDTAVEKPAPVVETVKKQPGPREVKKMPAPVVKQALPEVDQGRKSGPKVRRRIPHYAFRRPGGVRSSSVAHQQQEMRKSEADTSQTENGTQSLQSLQEVRLLKNKIRINQQEKCALEFTLDNPGRIQARIFSREGRLIRTLSDQELSAGMHRLEWGGLTDQGQKVASGIYILIITGDIEERRFKIAVIK